MKIDKTMLMLVVTMIVGSAMAVSFAAHNLAMSQQAQNHDTPDSIQCGDEIKHISLFDDTANVTVKIDPDTCRIIATRKPCKMDSNQQEKCNGYE